MTHCGCYEFYVADAFTSHENNERCVLFILLTSPNGNAKREISGRLMHIMTTYPNQMIMKMWYANIGQLKSTRLFPQHVTHGTLKR